MEALNIGLPEFEPCELCGITPEGMEMPCREPNCPHKIKRL